MTMNLAIQKTAKRDQSGRINRVAKAIWDFSVDGGAVSTISLGEVLPKNAIIQEVFADVLTACTSGGSATLQLKAGTTALIDATAYDSGFDATGPDEYALASSATAIKLSAASELKLAIATAALTAGKVHFMVQYCLSES